MTRAGDEAEELGAGEEEIEDLGEKEEEERLGEVAEDADNGKGHTTKVAERVAHECLGRVPVPIQLAHLSERNKTDALESKKKEKGTNWI